MDENLNAANELDETCARRTLGPWLVATAILICGSIGFAFYHAEDMRLTREANPPMQMGPLRSRGRSGAPKLQTAAAKKIQASFIPPWHGEQNPDSVTADTGIVAASHAIVSEGGVASSKQSAANLSFRFSGGSARDTSMAVAAEVKMKVVLLQSSINSKLKIQTPRWFVN